MTKAKQCKISMIVMGALLVLAMSFTVPCRAEETPPVNAGAVQVYEEGVLVAQFGTIEEYEQYQYIPAPRANVCDSYGHVHGSKTENRSQDVFTDLGDGRTQRDSYIITYCAWCNSVMYRTFVGSIIY